MVEGIVLVGGENGSNFTSLLLWRRREFRISQDRGLSALNATMLAGLHSSSTSTINNRSWVGDCSHLLSYIIITPYTSLL